MDISSRPLVSRDTISYEDASRIVGPIKAKSIVKVTKLFIISSTCAGESFGKPLVAEAGAADETEAATDANVADFCVATALNETGAHFAAMVADEVELMLG